MSADAQKPLDLDEIERHVWGATDHADDMIVTDLIAECRRLREDISVLEVSNNSMLTLLNKQREQIAALREYVEYTEIDKDGRDDWSEIVEYHERGKILRAKIGRTEEGTWLTP